MEGEFNKRTMEKPKSITDIIGNSDQRQRAFMERLVNQVIAFRMGPSLCRGRLLAWSDKWIIIEENVAGERREVCINLSYIVNIQAMTPKIAELFERSEEQQMTSMLTGEGRVH